MKKVLHGVYSMSTGGIEVWLLNTMQNLDQEKISFDFVAIKKGDFDDEIRKLGGNILYLNTKNPISIFFKLLKFLRKKRYDTIHIHCVMCAIPLLLAAGFLTGVKNRIFQFHNSYNSYLKQSFYISLQLFLGFLFVRLFANKIIAVSKLSGQNIPFFKKYFYKNTETIYLGLDFSAINNNDTIHTLEMFNLDPMKKTIVHVGRFSYQKNHTFLLKVVKSLTEKKQDFQVILFGDGELRSEIEQEIKQLEIDSFIFLPGVTRNIISTMRDIGDLFLFPSRYEGLPLSMVEAQAAGLPCLMADTITRDTVFTDQVEILSLEDSFDTWAAKCLCLLNRKKDTSKSYELAINSPFNIDNSLKQFESLWSK